MLDIVIGIAVILLCLGAATALVFYSTRQINRIARLKRSSYRDIVRRRHG